LSLLPLVGGVQEFGFELALCAHLENEERLVARQLGASVRGRRIVDTVVLEPGPELDRRAAITERSIPERAIAANVGPGRARFWKDAFEGVHPDRARSVIERAVDVGFFECERRNGRTYVRQTTRYPDRWVGRLVGIENKPDLDRPGDLQTQLRTDVSLGLFDAVILATADYVTGAHLNRIPDAVGVWRFDPVTGEREVVREPTPLDPEGPGVELLDRQPARTDIAIVDAEEERRAGSTVAERAYGKGWRTFEWPACSRCDPGRGADGAAVPYCTWAEGIVDPATECSPECAGHEQAEPPAIDPERVRAENTRWTPSPEGHQRRQTGLDRFG
jgi:hypothetical protein